MISDNEMQVMSNTDESIQNIVIQEKAGKVIPKNIRQCDKGDSRQRR